MSPPSVIALRRLDERLISDAKGDLAFGSSFGCLEASDYHPWVSLIFASIKTSGILSIIRRYVPTKVLYALIPTSAIQKIEDHRAMTTAKVQQRLATQTDRADFLSYILRHSTIDENSKDSHDGKGMSVPEITANSSLLIMAGSETTATALSGVTYLLLRNPAVLRKLTEEIRRRFKKEDEMTLSALGSCDYLNCVLKEGMRMYPPVALGLPRKVVQEEVTIAGNVVPKGVSAIHAACQHRKPRLTSILEHCSCPTMGFLLLANPLQ